MRALVRFLASPAFLLAAIAVLGGGAYSLWKAQSPPENDDSFEPVRYMMPQAPTTALTIRSVRAATALLAADELVLGVTIGKESRAYPINMMDHVPAHKVLNDTLGGRPIIASWCDSAHNALVYSRAVDGRTLTFGIAGQLWKDSLLMYDEETWTRWSHHLGRGKLGPLKDKKLEPIPSVMTSWQTWSRLHPQGTVAIFDTTSRHYAKQVYDEGGQFVLGIFAEGSAKCWSLAVLRQQPAINDVWNGQPVLAVFDLASATARLYSRRVSGRPLRFSHDGHTLIDQETRTSWDILSGKALAGPLAGTQLSPLPAFVSSRRTWQAFHPAQ